MENRRPPHANSSSRYSDRTRSNTSIRGDGGGDGAGRTRRKPERPPDGRFYERGADSRTRDGGPGRHLGRAFGRRGRPGYKAGDNRQSGRQADKGRSAPEIRITSDAQITDGKFRGKTLVNSISPHATPTNRKVREIAFKILSRRVKATRILDLGAASGTIGIEAISRGAMLATFVERSARMCSFIRKNLAALGIKDGHGEIAEMEALPFLQKTARRRRNWDIVYLDLPAGEAHTAIVEHVSLGTSIRAAGLLVIQHESSISFPEKINRLTRWRTVEQGETILSIYERM